MTIKRLYLDTETTGTDDKIHGLHQMSGYIEVDGAIVETFDLKIRPFDGCVVEAKALEVSNVTVEQLDANPLSDKEAYQHIKALMSKYVPKYAKTDRLFLVGYNVGFDKDFLAALFKRNGDNYLFSLIWGNSHDVMSIYSEKFEAYRNDMVDFKLMTVARKAGLVVDDSKLHDSMYDIWLTRELFLLHKKQTNIPCESKPTNEAMDMLMQHTKNDNKPIDSKLEIIMFGKHKGLNVGELIERDPQYLMWIHDNKVKDMQFSKTLLDEILVAMRTKKSVLPHIIVEKPKEDDLPF